MKAIAVHVFRPGRWRNYRGVRICDECGSLETDSVHKVPERGEDEKAIEARMLGERDG